MYDVQLDANNWKDVEGYEGYYQVNPLGDVRSINRYVVDSKGRRYLVSGRILKKLNGPSSYLMVGLSKNHVLKNISIHRLVAQAFLPNPDNLPQVNHIDGDKTNNCVINLEWCSAKQNNEHAWKTKLNKNYPREIKATNIDTGESFIYHSILEFSIKYQSSSASGCLDNGTECKTKFGTFKLEFTDKELAERFLKINSTKQKIGGNTPMPVVCVDTGEKFPSIRNCCRMLNISEESLRRALRYSNGYIRKYNLKFEFI